jgi:hypothetical protein
MSVEPAFRDHIKYVNRPGSVQAGLCTYVLSFFLVAIDDGNKFFGRMVGYQCAYSVVHGALTTTPFSPNSPDYAPPFIYFSILISALINPVFLAYVTLRFLKRTSRTTRPLKLALLSMIPFSWVVLRNLEVYPREGHICWVVGLLLVLFSDSNQVLVNGLPGQVGPGANMDG